MNKKGKLRVLKADRARTIGLMEMAQPLFLFLLTMFFCASCLYARTSSAVYTVRKSITIDNGSAILDIYGRANENLYTSNPFSAAANSMNSYNNPVINEGTITKNEIKYLSSGEEYSFSVLPAEVVTVNIRSLDENDVKVSVLEYGRKKEYTVKGTDKMGLFLSFQNR